MILSPSIFHLNVGTLPQSPDSDFVVKILDAEFFAQQVKITHLYLSIERNLTSRNAKYRVETRNFTIPAALTYKFRSTEC